MKNRTTSALANILMTVNHFVEETDIRILVFVPPVIGFLVLLVGVFVANLLNNGRPFPPVTDILLGIILSSLCFSGYAEIYKKEMPGPLGGIYKGNLAVISGALIVILSSIFGITALIHGISILLR